MMLPLCISLLVAAAATFVIWKCSDRIEEAGQALADHYGLSEVVKGSIILAVSSSFPELSSSVIATLVHGEFELGAAAIIGSAIFNILVIPAASVLIAGRSLPVDRSLVYKEAQFYLIAVSVLLITFCLGVIYLPLGPPGIRGALPWWIGSIPLGFYGLYLYIQVQDTRDGTPGERRRPEGGAARDWLILLACMGVVALAVEGLVRSALALGEIFGTPPFLWGLTVIAAGTSLPDMFISVAAARKGKSIASLSNVLGSNIFDLLVAVPAGILAAGVVIVRFERAVPMMGFLMLATVVMFVLMRRRLELSRPDAWIMLVLYAGFVAWMALESLGLSHVLGLT